MTFKHKKDSSKFRYMIIDGPEKPSPGESYDKGFEDGIRSVIDYLKTEQASFLYDAFDVKGQRWKVSLDVARNLEKELPNIWRKDYE